MMDFTIYTEIDINASPKIIWDNLVDLDNYKNWNPFIVSASGKIAPNEVLLCQPLTSDGKRHTFKPLVNHYIEEKEFSWVGSVVHPRIASGEHFFILEKLDDNMTKLIHKEIFSGLVSPFVILFAGNKTKQGFIEMNAALKLRIESRNND